MITKIAGKLETIENDTALIEVPGGLTYQVMVPAYTVARLGGTIGQQVSLYTLYFIEAPSQGSTMFPRLAGFLTAEDRAFFELFTTTKGIGYKKALRALALSSQQIAAAISDRDATLLQSLPEIGKRTAETIIASLRGKVDVFIAPPARVASAASGGGGGTDDADSSDDGAIAHAGSSLSREALDVLTQLGENRVTAMRWIDDVLGQVNDDERPQSVEELVALVYQAKRNA